MYHEKISEPILAQFYRLTTRYKRTHFLFLGALFLESILLVFFFPFLFKSALFAITLAALLVTIFSYFTMRNYQQVEKKELYKELAQKYSRGLTSLYPNVSELEARKIAAEGCVELAESSLLIPHKKEGKFFQTFGPFLRKINPYQEENNFKDFKVVLFKQAAEEITALIRLSPCMIPPHASLVEIAQKLANNYADLGDTENRDKFLSTAIEELKILSDLTPHEGAVYFELASCYGAMRMKDKEIKTLEKGREVDPENQDILFRLGQLYFSERESAKGFKIYEILKNRDTSKSDQLMSFYN